jgi:CubicO group peptidase (beta-lactamase class C family)
MKLFNINWMCFLILTISLCQLNGQTNEDQDISLERLNMASKLLQNAVDSQKIGCAFGLIARNGKILLSKGFGTSEDGTPLPTNTIVRLASITKTITAAAILKLYEVGKIRLDDDVSNYLIEYKELKVKVKDEKGNTELKVVEQPMTIFHLLTHQSGIASDGKEFWNVWDKARSLAEFSSLLSYLTLESVPGEKFNYGSMGSSYELLAAIAEKITGKSFNDFIREVILDPLKMNDTYFFVPESKLYRLGAVYKLDGNEKLIIFKKAGQEENPTGFYSGGGGLRSTVKDYFRFTQCLLNGGELDGVRILSPKSVQLMTTNQIDGGAWGKEWGWGMGVEVQLSLTDGNLGTVGAFGWNGGTGTRYVVDPKEKLIIIIFIPSTPGNQLVNKLRNQFVDAAYQSIVRSYVK